MKSLKSSLAILSLMVAPAVSAHTQSSSELSEIPAAIAAPAGEKLVHKTHAEGVQIYVCTQNKAGSYTWLFIAPSANLNHLSGSFTGTHSIGPVWVARDGSSVKAAKVSESPAPNGSIPWLLLKSVENKGHGKFGKVSSIQRVDTTGGVAPDLSLCNADALNTVSQVPYTATYNYFIAE